MSSNNKDVALALAARGLHVFPCNADKTPKVKAWEQNAVSSAFKIEAMWRNWPDALPSIPAGAHSLVVFDCDRRQGKADGVQAFIDLCAANTIDTSKFFVVETPSTGLHFYFRTDVPYSNSRGSLPDGIDVRGVGGYVIAPGATLPDGRSYRQIAGSWDAIPALPGALASALKGKSPAVVPGPSVSPVVTDREREYAQAALADECSKVAASEPGTCNAILNIAAYSMGTMVGAGWLEYETAANALWEATSHNWTFTWPDGKTKAEATIKSGLNAGIEKPRTSLTVSRVQATQSQDVVLTPFSSIQRASIKWLWKGYLPLGKLVLLAGQGGVGKSTLACTWASVITTAGLWPDGTRCAFPGNVLIWASEDAADDTIGPRLDAAGADISRCYFIGGRADNNGVARSFDPAKDMDSLNRVAAQIGNISLLIIDPIVNAVTGDMNKSNEVRRALQTFVDFAATHRCVVLGVSHFTKGSAGQNSAERILGSSAFKDFARTALVAVQDEETGECAMARAKTNIAVNSGGFSYRIESVHFPPDIETIRIIWGAQLEGSARSILSKYEKSSKEDAPKRHAAKQFLIEALNNGPAAANELIKHAREGYGITEDTLREAYAEIGMKPSRIGFGKGSVSMWSIPLATHV